MTVLEGCPSGELPPASPSAAVRPDRDKDGRFLPGNRASKARKVRTGKRGALFALIRTGDDAARAAAAYGQRYASNRRAELAKAHGGEISDGVGAMIESAGELQAAARYWSARGMAEGNADYARLAAQLIAGSRQAERDAWELASREATVREANKPNPYFYGSYDDDQGTASTDDNEEHNE